MEISGLIGGALRQLAEGETGSFPHGASRTVILNLHHHPSVYCACVVDSKVPPFSAFAGCFEVPPSSNMCVPVVNHCSPSSLPSITSQVCSVCVFVWLSPLTALPETQPQCLSGWQPGNFNQNACRQATSLCISCQQISQTSLPLPFTRLHFCNLARSACVCVPPNALCRSCVSVDLAHTHWLCVLQPVVQKLSWRKKVPESTDVGIFFFSISSYIYIVIRRHFLLARA